MTAPQPPIHRWRLHRGGIVNIWHYAEQVFDFSGGRAIFQGTNGSGKSRTLELLLPLCLDGELRQLGSKGFDTVSIRRLMLDDYDGGPNRIGYAWIELMRGSTDAPEYLTCGIGIKASKAAQQITDSWRMITPRRVGVDFDLAGPDRVPVGPAQLREALGADAVLDDGPFRARVAELVYGLPAARYGDLLHLQRTLRNPDVGLKVLEGQLEQILSDALPPLDNALIEQLAGSFDDLESIRENITRLTTADAAMRQFLSSYSGYALGSLRTASDKTTAAADSVRTLADEVSTLDGRLSTLGQERLRAEERVDQLETAESELENRIDALKSLPAYSGLRDLADRERLVAAARAAAVSALDTSARQRAQEDRAVDAALAVLRRLDQDAAAAAALLSQTGHLLGGAGLDSRTPTLPEIAPPVAHTVTELVRAKPDPEAEPLPVERRIPPEVDANALAERFAAAGAQVAESANATGQRAALTLTLHQQAKELSDRQREIDDLRRTAMQAQIAATDAAGRRNEAEQQRHLAAEIWTERLSRWRTGGPAELVAAYDDRCAVTVDDLVASRDTVRTAHAELRTWAVPRLAALRQQVPIAEANLAALRRTADQLTSEQAELHRGDAGQPERRNTGRAERDPTRGAPFHRLVDFAPELSESDKAGLEAALEASGLLDAWVTASGELTDPDLNDVLATPLDEPSTSAAPTAARVLVPAVESDCPVGIEIVRRLLSSITLLTDSPAGASEPHGDGLAVGLNGRWRAGVLSGAFHKAAAEHIGAGAREAARRRRLSEIAAEQSRLDAEVATARTTLTEINQEITDWQTHLDAFPDDGELIAAHAKLQGARETATEAETRARGLREEHHGRDERFQAARTELIQQATAAGLPTETNDLDRAHRAVIEARASARALREALIDRCAATARHLAEALDHHRAALADRVEAERTADEACADHADQAAALTELNAAVGSKAGEITSQLSTLEEQRRAARRDLPEARERVATLREQVTKTVTLLETRRGQLQGRRLEADTAARDFEDALYAPGVWSAAMPETPEAPTVTAARESLAGIDRRGGSESTVISRLQALQTSLAGTHDIAAARHAGILTVTVTGDDGPHAVADAARRVAERLAEQRGYLGDRYQSIFATYLIRDLAERLRDQLVVADDLCRRMNEVLDRAHSSQGVHVQLEWRPSASLDDDTKAALDLVRKPLAERSRSQDEMLRRVFTDRIEAQREANTGGYSEILARALDYRDWHSFTVRVRDTGPDGRSRVRRLRQLSSGETRLVSYVTLFAAAASFYDAVSATHTHVATPDGRARDSGAVEASTAGGPLRLALLDEAFERLDDPTIARMLGLLVELDLDWIITWPSGWGVSPKIPRMHIYDVLRPKNGRGVACTHTTWDGSALARTE